MLKFILLVLAGYGLLVVAVYFLQGRMLYLPNTPGRTLNAAPIDAGMEYEDISIETADGIVLHGWFVGGRSSQVLLFFHGNAGNISHRLESIRQFHDLGLSVLIIDYRGFGQSGGNSSEKGLYQDAEAAWRHLTEDRAYAANDIIIFGRSLGGSVASWLATQHQPRALVVESSFTSVPDVAADLYPWLPVRQLSRFSHATRDYVRDVHSPLLVIHSRDDEIIPFHHGESIFAAANEPRTFLALRGSHNDAFLRDKRVYVEGMQTFLHSLSVPELPAPEL